MRLLNRVFAAVLALLLIALGVVLVVEVIADRTTHRSAIVHWHGAYDWAARTPWTQGSVRVVCVVLAVLGLVLLIAELKRPQVRRLGVQRAGDGTPPVDVAYTRRGVAAAVRTAVTDVDGVRSAEVTVTRRKVRVIAGTSAGDQASAANLAEPVRAAAAGRLAALELRHDPKLSIDTKARTR